MRVEGGQRTSSRGRGRLILRLQVQTLQRLNVALDPRLPSSTLLLRPIQLRGAHARGRHLAGAGKLLAVLLLAHLRRCREVKGGRPSSGASLITVFLQGATVFNTVEGFTKCWNCWIWYRCSAKDRLNPKLTPHPAPY